MGLGIGIGHFIGWSEKLELQEMYAEERETKMEELTDSLVSLYMLICFYLHTAPPQLDPLVRRAIMLGVFSSIR